jgi:hypothetical protein
MGTWQEWCKSDQCEDLRELWSSSLYLSKSRCRETYAHYVCRPVHDSVISFIGSKIYFGGSSHLASWSANRTPGSKSVNFTSNPKQLLVLEHEFYAGQVQRERLSRLLIAIVKWHPSLQDWNLAFFPATFISTVMAVMGSERRSFAAVVALYERLELGEYFQHSSSSPDSPFIAEDVQKTWALINTFWPAAAAAFRLHEAASHAKLSPSAPPPPTPPPSGQPPALFTKLVEPWLLSLLTTGYDEKKQPFKEFVILFSRLVCDAAHNTHDPRATLRYMVACIFAWHCNALAKCEFTERLEIFAGTAMSYIHVDQELLDLVDARLDICQKQSGVLTATGLLPAGCAVGWMVGVGAASVVLPAMSLGIGVAGMVLGGLSAATLGYSSGQSQVQELLREMDDME